jgi:hypothetical protein
VAYVRIFELESSLQRVRYWGFLGQNAYKSNAYLGPTRSFPDPVTSSVMQAAKRSQTDLYDGNCAEATAI